MRSSNSVSTLVEIFGFSAVDKAYKLLLEQEQKKRALDVIQAGKEYVEHIVSTVYQLLCNGVYISATLGILY